MIDKEECGLPRRHIASITQSDMIVLNLDQLQKMGRFSYEVALTDQEDHRIHAYQHAQVEDCYLIMIPFAFYSNNKNRSKLFIELLCLCSQTITVVLGNMVEQMQELLESFCLQYRPKRGSNVVKFYLSGECWATYLDFVTWQSIQFKANNCKQLIAMKRSNAYEYCLSAFKQELLPHIFSMEQSVEDALDCCISDIRDIYNSLTCKERFEVVYEVMKQDSCTLAELEKDIQGLVLSRQVTTLGDEECEEIVNRELCIIVERELQSQEKQLDQMRANQQQVFFIKILHNLLKTLRTYNFEINDEKYLFLISKIIENIYELQDRQREAIHRRNVALQQTVTAQKQEIERLKEELEAAKMRTSTARKETQLYVIEQTPLLNHKPANNHNENETRKEKVKLSIKDLKQPLQILKDTINNVKEPLQILNTNVSTDKLQKVGLAKAKEKLREGLRRKEEGKQLRK